ncbi:helix-turn-helix domain-containing protein [Mycobacterium avium]|uniref:helix-turn-helix domain-containing protein n=1 Tax=Mycobacterium avium TaxID=1764 RepID=UPI00355BE9FB
MRLAVPKGHGHQTGRCRHRAGEPVIQRVTGGVLLSDDAAAYLLRVVEQAAHIRQPSARVVDLIRRLRRELGKPASTHAIANGVRAKKPDLGDLLDYDLLTAAEAAAVIGCSTANVGYLRRHRHLPARRAGSRWLYSATGVAAYAESRASQLRR